MRKYKIVIVENDEDEQYFMKQGFESANLFDVLAMVRNGDNLFEWMAENRSNLPEIILSDLNMPGKNGYDIIQEIKNTPLYSHIPVIITSTSSTPSIIEKCLAMGATEYIVKPDVFIEYLPFIKKLHTLIDEQATTKQRASG